MKREIVCKQCAPEIKKLFRDRPADTEGPAEFGRTKDGIAIDHFICDSCDGEIRAGDFACAASAWQEDDPIGGVNWEEEYIDYQKEGENHANR